MKTAMMIILALVMLGCGSDKEMATIGEEVNSTLVDTNVTDDTQVYDTTNITISAHMAQSTMIIKNGALYGTGDNSFGSLGLGSTQYFNTFTDTGVRDVKSVTMGQRVSFIIKTDDTLHATGFNNNGMLGLGDTVDRDTFTDTGITNVKSVFCGDFSTFIIKKDGTLWEVITNAFTDTGITNVKFGSAGRGHILIIKDDNTLWSRGENSMGQCGVGTNDDVLVFTDTGVTDVRVVACGAYFTMIIKNDGYVHSTGRNNHGQLALNDEVDVNVFTNTAVSSVKTVSAGSVHTIITKENDTLWTVGYNSEGELGLEDNNNRDEFTDTNVTSVLFAEAGNLHSMIIKNDGTLFGSGRNSYGELGIGDNTNVNIFTDTSEILTTYVSENWTPLHQSDIVKIDNYRYTVTLPTDETPNIFTTLTQIGFINELKPFDGQNITPAISSSPMTYKITGTEEFNSFTLAKVLATSVTYKFRLSGGSLIKEETIAIDCKRDENGTLALYPTTVVYYAGQQMPEGSTVEISLTHSDDIELGDFTLNNSIDAGFTNLSFSHGIKDYNDYTPDAWGNIPESVKAIVTTFKVTLDFPLTNYDYIVSFNESIAGKNVTIDASDSNGAVADGETIFAALTRRVRVTSPSISSKVKDGSLATMATLSLTVQEIV